MPEGAFRINGRLVFGLAIITLGVLFTLDNLGLMDAGAVLQWWPAVLIAYGLTRLFGFGCRRNSFAGVLLSLLGVALLLNNLDLLHVAFHDLWPFGLIAVGLAMVARTLSRGAVGEAGGVDSSSTLRAFAFMSGIGRKVIAENFQGGEITAVLGGHKIDLRGARMVGDQAVVDLFVVMGGVDFNVPADWKVTLEALAVMGGIENQTRQPVGEVRGNLVLRGVVLM